MNLYDGLGLILEDANPLILKGSKELSKDKKMLQVITGWVRNFFG